jgi:CubicO group peptidase (beta-lactamase class C family)
LQFVNDGKIRLDGHVSEYLPSYRRDTGKRITISELLSHTSGVPNSTDLPGLLEGPASRVRYGVRVFAQKDCSGDLQFEPGTKFEYSNSGYFLLREILEEVSGVSYEELLLQDRIFKPSGMKNSG